MYWITVQIHNDAETIERSAHFSLPEEVNDYLTELGQRFEDGDLLFPSDYDDVDRSGEITEANFV